MLAKAKYKGGKKCFLSFVLIVSFLGKLSFFNFFHYIYSIYIAAHLTDSGWLTKFKI